MNWDEDELVAALDEKPKKKTGFESHVVKATDYWEAALREILNTKEGHPLKRFHFFSHAIKGLRAGEFTIFCGATGIGKTSFLSNLSLDLMEQSIPQLVFSIENGPTDFCRRIMSAVIGSDVESGPMALERIKRFEVEMVNLIANSNLSLGLYEDRLSIERLMAEVSLSVELHKTQVVIVDNINFMLEPTTAENAVIEMDRVIHKLIMFCKEKQIHMIMVMHPRKTSTSRVESEFDIKGSSTAVQEAHNVWLFNRPTEESVKDGTCSQFDRELTIAKCRRVGTATNQKFIFQTEGGVKYIERKLC